MYFGSGTTIGDEELKEDIEEERKDRREIIPSMFSNSRNQQERSMLNYNQAGTNPLSGGNTYSG
jgi:hypothetical protein